MKLTFLELIVLGKLTIENYPPSPRRLGWGTRARDARAWVPEGASPPEDPTLLSVFEAARQVSSKNQPASVIDIAGAAKWIEGNARGSTINAWLSRFPLSELYEKGLMRTSKRLLLRDVPKLTEDGNVVRAELKRRLESLEMMPGMDKRTASNTLHLAGTSFLLVESSWPAIESMASSIKRESAPAASGGGGDVGDDSFEFPELNLHDLDFGGFDLGGADFGGGGDAGGGGGDGG